MSTGFLPRITLPTRFSNKSCSLIDQIFCNFENPTEKCETAILTSRLTDHLPCLLTFEIAQRVKKTPKYVMQADNSEKNTERYI